MRETEGESVWRNSKWNDISVNFGGIKALSDVTFTIEEGSICGLIGPNGAGKTTMFNVISRIYDPSSGSVVFNGRDLVGGSNDVAPHMISDVGIFRTFQNLALWERMSVLENVMAGAHVRSQAEHVHRHAGASDGPRRKRRCPKRPT